MGKKDINTYLKKVFAEIERNEYYHTIYKNKANDLEWYAFNQEELEQFLLEKYKNKDELTKDLKENHLIIIRGTKKLNFN